MSEVKEHSDDIVQKFIKKIEELKLKTKKDLSKEALKGKESLDSVLKYIKDLGYSTPKLPTDIKLIKNFVNDQIHHWGMSASGGLVEDMESRDIQRKWDGLDIKCVNAYLEENRINVQMIEIFNEAIDRISKIK